MGSGIWKLTQAELEKSRQEFQAQLGSPQVSNDLNLLGGRCAGIWGEVRPRVGMGRGVLTPERHTRSPRVWSG